jgi:2-dehydropantoate 2-reductase
MKICIYGAGAVGGLMAGWLARAGHAVSVVARGANLTAIREKGLRVRSEGKETAYRVQADSDAAKLGLQDCVIVAVKGQSLAQVASGIGPLMGERTSIVTAMNGVPWWFFDRLKFGGGKLRLESLDPGGALSRAMPTEHIVGCVVHLAASTPEPAVISHNMGRRLILGEPGGKNTGLTKGIADALTQAGFECVQSPFIEKDFWVKLLGNVSFNPVSALTLSTADRLIADAEVRYTWFTMREVLAICRAVGVTPTSTRRRIDMRAPGCSRLHAAGSEARRSRSIPLTGTPEVARRRRARAVHREPWPRACAIHRQYA